MLLTRIRLRDSFSCRPTDVTQSAAQDPAMVVHPPMLYYGLRGFFSGLRVCDPALISGRLDARWARWSRPPMTVSDVSPSVLR